MGDYLKALRPHQWVKNVLLFVPLITAHRLFDLAAVSSGLQGFLAFSLVASGTYILNDLFDLEADRSHNKKRHRAFAAGALSLKSGLIAFATLLAAGVWTALTLPLGFQLALLAYLLSTLLYSFWLKRVASLDVLILAGLYTLRVIAGGFAASVPPSFWLLAFSMFMFLCLALVKRIAELIELTKQEQRTESEPSSVRGREYKTDDIPILQILGATSGYLSVLVFALYINSEEVIRLYQTPKMLWLIAPLLLLWLTRLWVSTARGNMHEDPIFFAIKDPGTWMTALITTAILATATAVDF